MKKLFWGLALTTLISTQAYAGSYYGDEGADMDRAIVGTLLGVGLAALIVSANNDDDEPVYQTHYRPTHHPHREYRAYRSYHDDDDDRHSRRHWRHHKHHRHHHH